jgi:hypothetical protein
LCSDFIIDADVNMHNEPGPSQHPSRTQGLVTQPSQRTLVGSSPASKSAHEIDAPHSIQERSPSAIAPVEEVAVAVENPVASRATRAPARKMAAVVAPTSPKRPVRRIKKPKVASQNIAPIEVSAPYRNTRSRSRSLEPIQLVAKKTRSHKRKAQSVLPTVQDRPDEEGEEVQDVADQLALNDRGATVQAESFNGDAEVQLDFDDQQTHDALQTVTISDDDDSDSARMVAQMRRSRGPRGPTTASDDVFRNAHLLAPAATTGSSKRGNPVVTPSGQGRKESSANSSGESAHFPTPGTRAYKARNQLEMKERRLPYVPPRGTRAAALKK